VREVPAGRQEADGRLRELLVYGLQAPPRDDAVVRSPDHHSWQLGDAGEEVEEIPRACLGLWTSAQVHQRGIPALAAGDKRRVGIGVSIMLPLATMTKNCPRRSTACR